MNRLYAFQVRDGRLKSNLWVSASDEESAIQIFKVCVPARDAAGTERPADVTESQLRADRTNLLEVLRSGVSGTVTKLIPFTTPAALTQALLMGDKPTMQGKAGWSVAPARAPSVAFGMPTS